MKQNKKHQRTNQRVKYKDPDLSVEKIEFNTLSQKDIKNHLKEKGYYSKKTKKQITDAEQAGKSTGEYVTSELEREPLAEYFAEVDPESNIQDTPEPVVEPSTEDTPEPVGELSIEDIPEPVVEPSSEDIPEPVVEPSAEDTYEPVGEPSVENAPEMVIKPSEETIADGNKKKNKKTWLTLIIIAAALGLMTFSMVRLLSIRSEYNAGSTEYEEIADKVIEKEKTINIPADTDIQEEQINIPVIDFKQLKEINEDVVGWIYFEEPEIINYPVTRGLDNEFYLTHTYNRSENSAGSIFMDMYNADEMTDANVIIYGHNMKNDSMFAQLELYLKEDFALAHPLFYIYTAGGGVYQYRIYSVYETDDNSRTYTVGFANRDDYGNYLESCKGHSKFDFNTEISPDKPSITLSTCTNYTDEGRYVVQAILDKVIIDGVPDISVLNW